MMLIETLDKQITDFYRTHNYWWPAEIVMSQNTMNKLRREICNRGFCDWKGDKFNHVPLKVSNAVADDDFVLIGAPESKHHKCSFCDLVDGTEKQWHRLDDGFLCESSSHGT